jgi:hypothetical protein
VETPGDGAAGRDINIDPLDVLSEFLSRGIRF